MSNKKQKPRMEDYEVMCFIIDNYGPGLDTPTALIKHLRNDLKKSCSVERFKEQFTRYMRKYADQNQ